MRVLLINSNRYKLPVPAMPFGLCCIAAALERAGNDVDVLDLCFSKACSREIEERLETFNPDIVGISVRNIDTCATYNTLFLLNQVKEEVMEPVKSKFSGPIIIGGPSVGISGPEMLSFFDLEFAIRGDGELAMIEFTKRIEKNIPLNGLQGLIWRKDEQIVEDNPPMRVNNLDSLPFANHHRYIDTSKYKKYKSPIQVQTKRGCALKCSYCTYNTIEGHNIRLRSPERIADEIEEIVKTSGFKHIEFTDSAFNFPLDHAKAVLRAIIAKKLDVRLQTMGLNPGAIDEEFAQLMSDANFQEVHVGVESGCNATLKSLGKNFSKEDIFRAAKHLHEKKLPILWYILTGAPDETRETLTETFETISQVSDKSDLIVVGNGIRVYKGAPLAKRMIRENPGCTKDNFLLPISYSPKSINLRNLRLLNKRNALRHPNVLFFDEVQRVPEVLLKIQTTLMRLLAPGKPWWKSYIVMNRVLSLLGIFSIRRFLFEFKNRNLFDRLKLEKTA